MRKQGFYGLRIKHSAIHNSVRLMLLCCILTTILGLVGCRSGGIRVRSWDEAIRFTQQELEAAGDLESRLEGYAQTADRLAEQIDVLDQARPGLELIDRLRHVQVPLIGNGWQILLTLFGLATVDGAKIIAKLEGVLRGLAELKDSLEGLSSLPKLAAAVRHFRGEPNRRSLGTLSAASATATPSLRRLHVDLGEILEPLKDVSDNLGALVKGLRSGADADIPVVSDVARQSAERISHIEGPLLSLRDGLNQLYEDIGADVEVLERIPEAVRQAREHEE